MKERRCTALEEPMKDFHRFTRTSTRCLYDDNQAASMNRRLEHHGEET
jgi:hypothetical protein